MEDEDDNVWIDGGRGSGKAEVVVRLLLSVSGMNE